MTITPFSLSLSFSRKIGDHIGKTKGALEHGTHWLGFPNPLSPDSMAALIDSKNHPSLYAPKISHY